MVRIASTTFAARPTLPSTTSVQAFYKQAYYHQNISLGILINV
jgi:hypothetical protein